MPRDVMGILRGSNYSSLPGQPPELQRTQRGLHLGRFSMITSHIKSIRKETKRSTKVEEGGKDNANLTFSYLFHTFSRFFIASLDWLNSKLLLLDPEASEESARQ